MSKGTRWSQIAKNIIWLPIAPIRIYLETFRLKYLEMKLKISPADETLNEKYETKKRMFNLHVKLELGLETIYQLAGQSILLILSYTKTATQNGLKSIFNEDFGIGLGVSIILSFISCVTSHLKALSASRERFPFVSKVIVGFYCMFGCLTRVMSIIMFFAPSLGLFSLLKHLQGEQIPWDTGVLDMVGPDDLLFLGNNEPVEWLSIDRWSRNLSEPKFLHNIDGTLQRNEWNDLILNPAYLDQSSGHPTYILYTYFSLEIYFLIFVGLILLHMIVVYIAKSMLSQDFGLEFNLLEKIIHSLENTNLPYNVKEWDDALGNALDHWKRMQSNWVEIRTIIIIKGVFNLIFLSPMCFLGNLFPYKLFVYVVLLLLLLFQYTKCKKDMISLLEVLAIWIWSKKL